MLVPLLTDEDVAARGIKSLASDRVFIPMTVPLGQCSMSGVACV